MSHFTRIKTKMTQKAFLLKALEDCGYAYEEGPVKIRGYQGKKTDVEVRIPHSRDYDIGFRKVGERFEVVADWYGIRGIKKKDFVNQLTTRYSYHATVSRLIEQEFEVASEEVGQDGRLHLVLRRTI